MNTPVIVRVEGPDAIIAIDEIRRLDNLFNKFSPDSEITKLNRGEKINLSEDTVQCLKLAEEMKRLTNGAFDVGLGAGTGLRLDLGGIAKGYAVEKARHLLLKSGAKSGIIDMRSSIAVFGRRSWKIGIQHPREKDKLLGIVELQEGQALSTSGDYERGQHIVDPRTHKSARKCQSVTLVGTNAAQLDALSTAVFVLGSVKGLQLLEGLVEVEGLVVDAEGKISRTRGFKLL
ncbi:hypothetical protein A2291_07670 [candidate division WOR-1 bacterium RIFOXYB2_FULL_42_35]|uniref:FAD:protein FMN transferase n=1 Tax=candidate division WOR-1 bacterium RIFOXYC2_FULL_41_25 TaxID=1802586 RepID=A0A1F4TJK1_UNCSA|nr:MAG: hypothetical protein A2247_08195 [candidate division WOR-1 bacterium RIFOXYA2_FULL_41_14]OGC21802.1 MAG: hypothetical protein A2291_07670 [candidate division WOR-1 bacterium RIFOXYB2_FULL_42_35]OGC32700.1 MAG: hypothetical protein A2462_04060 [candidate division WOR-1 bacterium RIFOXYC2_FULL_41_25]OGC42581.1 MAG: hypothetical protein A2548_06200 [candidate division WOR-1 bacterium RIFOXYD2_FULL_41_8]